MGLLVLPPLSYVRLSPVFRPLSRPTKIVLFPVSITSMWSTSNFTSRLAIVALAETPSPFTLPPPATYASFVTVATLTLTPTPTLVPPPETVEPPSAKAVDSVRFCESRLSTPVLPEWCVVTVRPTPSTALDVLLVTVTATAPATLTLEPDELSPLEVLALALLVSPVLPAAPESAVVALFEAASFCPVTFWSTLLPPLPPWSVDLLFWSSSPAPATLFRSRHLARAHHLD